MRYYDRERGLVGSFNQTTDAIDQLITLQELKDFLAVSGTADDNLLTSFILASRKTIESYIDKSLLDQTWTLSLNRFPFGDDIPLVRGPLQSVTSVTYYNTSDVSAVQASSTYYVDTAESNGAIVLNSGSSWASTSLRPRNGVEIVFVSGYGDTLDEVPEPLRVANMLIIEQMYEGCPEPISDAAHALLSPYIELDI